MFIPYNNASIRLTGRFYEEKNAVSTTACGSYIEAAIKGDWAILHFDMTDLIPSYPSLYIQIDGQDMIGSAVCSRLYLRMKDAGNHVIKVIFKGACEKQNRWFEPVQAKVSFEGTEAEAAGVLPSDNRKTITFIGDSITEGILIFPEQTPYKNNLMDRVYQDDVTRSYAWIVAEQLNLRASFCAYGAVGMTKSGSGSVPKAIGSYPYCVDGKPFSDAYEPDYIMINHGCNDRGSTPEAYCGEYETYLDMLTLRYPSSKIIVLASFIGAHIQELKTMVHAYIEKSGKEIHFIDTTGWVAPSPVHPLVQGHETIASNLLRILPEIL